MGIYLDAAPIIYAVEQVPPWAALVQARISMPEVQVVASDLAVLECRVRPLRLGQNEIVRNFDKFFDEGLAEVVRLTQAVMLKAATLRATHVWLRTPDAIHLAAALVSQCDVFLTNDQRLSRCQEIPVEVLK